MFYLLQPTITLKRHTLTHALFLATTAMVLTACGGGGSSSSTPTATATTAPTGVTAPSTKADTVSTPTNPALTTATPEATAVTLLNKNRSLCRFGELTQNANLTTSAINHANYLKVVSESNTINFASHHEQQETGLTNTGIMNPYYSGLNVSDRLDPQRLGTRAIKPVSVYSYASIGENIALSLVGTTNNSQQLDKNATAENMLTGLLAAPYHMRTLVAPGFTEVGTSYLEAKWTGLPYYYTYSILEMVSARPQSAGGFVNKQLLNYPCEGSVTADKLTHEAPNPIPNRDLEKFPIGQPVYVLAPADKTITQASVTMTTKGVTIGTIHVLTKATDPNQLLDKNEAIFIPDQPLAANTTYTVSYHLIFSDGGEASRSFNFTTQPTPL